MTTVADATYRILRNRGLTTIFGNPGSNELPFLAHMPEDFTYVLGLHEGAVVSMAEGYSLATGGPAFVNLHSASGTGNAMGGLTNAVYSHSRQVVLIPAGARVLGETKPVQAFGETRLAVTFHRLLMPDGRTYRLDEFTGLNQIGDAGLRDRVNQHYLATFGAAAAVGLISGLAQFVGNVGLGGGDGDRTVVIASGVGDATSQATMQVMNRFLNRLPTVTIREGHRVKVYLTSDLELPAYRMTGP